MLTKYQISVVSQPCPQHTSLDSLKSSFRFAQTQTEKKVSLFQQFMHCFLANEKFRYFLSKVNYSASHLPSEKTVKKQQHLLELLSTLFQGLIVWQGKKGICKKIVFSCITKEQDVEISTRLLLLLFNV